MARYRVQWSYSSSAGGPWTVGQVVDLNEDAAAAVDRSSPGVLVPDGPEPATAAEAGPPVKRTAGRPRKSSE